VGKPDSKRGRDRPSPQMVDLTMFFCPIRAIFKWQNGSGANYFHLRSCSEVNCSDVARSHHRGYEIRRSRTIFCLRAGDLDFAAILSMKFMPIGMAIGSI
jgi:hypothetical protein